MSLSIGPSFPQGAEGHMRWHLSNGWFIDREERVHRRHMGYKYSIWAPGASKGGNALFIAGSRTLDGAVGTARRLAPSGQARRKPAGQARSRGGLTIPQERERRVVDARLQPRTPVTRQRFFFKPFHRPPPPRRRPLDEETRREYEQRYIDLGYGLEGAAHAISRLRGEIDSDVYDRGNYVDYRHHAKGKKAFTPTGRRVTHRPEVGFDTAIKAAKARLRELTADYRAQRREQKEIDDILRYGEKPGHYRKRLARRRRR